jgi:hypothetical protein
MPISFRVLIFTSFGLFFSGLSAFHIFVIGHAVYSIQAFLNFTLASIFVTFQALSFLKPLIPRSVCAALTEKAGERSQEKHKHSETHFTPFLAAKLLFLYLPNGIPKIFYVMGDETSRPNFY